jgi:ribosome-binding factor A
LGRLARRQPAILKRMARPAAAKAPSQRQLRVGELVRHALSEILQRGEVHDPALEATVVTVPEVRMSPDLRLATAYVMPLGGKGSDEVVAALDRNKKYLRGEVAHRVNLRYAPELRFRVDTSFEEGERVDALLRSPEVRRDVEPGGEDDN